MVIVDERGGSGGLQAAKKRLSALHNRGVDADLGHLDFGDYAIAGNGPEGTTVMVGIELKTTRDIINSLRSNRLTGYQVPGLVQMYEGRAWLLTEGIWREGQGGDFECYLGGWQTFSAGNRPIQMADMEGWILSAVQKGGLAYWHSALQTDTARFVAGLNHWWCDKTYEQHRTYDVIYRKPPDRALFTEPSDFVKMVSVIDKVGWTKAAALEQRYESLDDLMLATAEELQEVPGIGETIAESIVKTLHKQRKRKS